MGCARGAGCDADWAFCNGERPGSGEVVALLWASRARLLSELDRTMLCFSASIPLMWASVGLLGGGVGGMSPVMLTRASMPVLKSLRAACGGILNMSSAWAASVDEDTWFSGLCTRCRLGSVAGTGGGGGEGTALESLPGSVSAVVASGRGSPLAMVMAVGASLAGIR
jgi:hypothetical protein